MRLLAVDQGSIALGLASFEGTECRDTWLVRAKQSRGHMERLRDIGAELRQLRQLLSGRAWDPDVIAIEDVMVWRHAQTAVTMGETRGYLIATFHAIFPQSRIVAVNPSSVRKAVGAPRDRDGAKAHTMAIVAGLLGRPVSEDEADAVAIGMAALATIREGELAAMANGGPR